MHRILHLEDRADDAILIEETLNAHGVSAGITVVRNRLEFASALEETQYDLVLADSGLPGFTGQEALELVRSKYSDLGFIFMSGTAGREHVTIELKEGATDHVPKDQLWRLASSVRRELENGRLKRKVRAMTRLVTAVQELSLAKDLHVIVEIVRRAARELTGADGASFVLRDRDFCHYADEDAIQPLWKGKRFPMSTCISGWVMLNGKPAVIEDIYVDPRIPADAYRPTFVKSLAMVPIRTEAPLGAIGNYWATKRMPSPDELELLQALANTTAVAMEKVRVYEELEHRVKDRTAELEFANRELDSFSHAVSHDLGAPLRAVRGFTEIAIKESASVLNDRSRDCLSRVLSSTIQMRSIIDDLLRLSQITRAPLMVGKVDLGELARGIVNRLHANEPNRKVDALIGFDLEVNGDYGLLSIVLDNLLSNAWKYSGKCEYPRIQFERVAGSDTTDTFCVRDNGAGFDMRYAKRLFQPFQRMHNSEQFPGTGIGLTTAQRIIHRHGGQIWAEAEIDKGAAFFFSIGRAKA